MKLRFRIPRIQNTDRSRRPVARGVLSLSLFALFVLTSAATWAASIQQVKGTKALLVLEGLSVQPGTELYAINAEQKRKAVLRVSQVKADRAIADITQGAAAPGMLIIIKSSTPTMSAPDPIASSPTYSQPTSSSSSSRTSKKMKAWGVIGGMGMNTMALTVKAAVPITVNATGIDQDDLALKGNSYNVKGFFDYQPSPTFTLRFQGGLEPLSVTGSTTHTAVCSNGTACSLSINYLNLEGDAQYNLVSSPHRIWLGAGFGFLITMSSSTTVTGLSAATTNQLVLLSAGADFKVGTTSFIPIVAEYGLFPFAGVTLNAIYVRTGFGMRF